MKDASRESTSVEGKTEVNSTVLDHSLDFAPPLSTVCAHWHSCPTSRVPPALYDSGPPTLSIRSFQVSQSDRILPQ